MTNLEILSNLKVGDWVGVNKEPAKVTYKDDNVVKITTTNHTDTVMSLDGFSIHVGDAQPKLVHLNQTNTTLLMFALGWQGGTIHQLVEALNILGFTYDTLEVLNFTKQEAWQIASMINLLKAPVELGTQND